MVKVEKETVAKTEIHKMEGMYPFQVMKKQQDFKTLKKN